MIPIHNAQKKYPLIPLFTLQVLYRYGELKLEPGTFVSRVLSNDLKGTFDYADVNNEKALKQIIRFIYFELPPESWGDSDKVIAWLASKKHLKGTDITNRD